MRVAGVPAHGSCHDTVHDAGAEDGDGQNARRLGEDITGGRANLHIRHFGQHGHRRTTADPLRGSDS